MLFGQQVCKRQAAIVYQTVQQHTQGVGVRSLGIITVPVDLRRHIGQGSPQLPFLAQQFHRNACAEIAQQEAAVPADKQVLGLYIQMGHTGIPALLQSITDINT